MLVPGDGAAGHLLPRCEALLRRPRAFSRRFRIRLRLLSTRPGSIGYLGAHYSGVLNGLLADLDAVRAAVDIPILVRDFIVAAAKIQIHEARSSCRPRA